MYKFAHTLQRLAPPCFVSILLLASACSRGVDSTPPAVQADAPQPALQPDWREDHEALGKSTYETTCANCHETGKGGAPRPGRPEDWADRSNMWQAVLFNHAKEGYLDMPSKGGDPELTDQAVEAAAEYMLNRTFPELPRD